MRFNAVIPSLGLLVQIVLPLPFCVGRPHAHGHSHGSLAHNAIKNDTASSGSSLIPPSGTTTWDSFKFLPRPIAAPGASKGIGDLSIHPSINLPFGEVKPSNQKNLVILHTSGNSAGAEPSAPTNSSIQHQEVIIATVSPGFATDANLLTTSVTIAYSKTTGTAVNSPVGSSTQFGLAILSSSTPEATIRPSTNPPFKVRRAHEELHRTRTKRIAQSSGHLLAGPNSRLSIRANDDEICPTRDQTTFTSRGSKTYRVVCDVDFPDTDYPYLFVHSFEECIDACDAFNARGKMRNCLGALFVPSRLNGADDCYLKSVVDNPAPARLPIQGAILVQTSQFPKLLAKSTTSSKRASPTSALSESKKADTADATTSSSPKAANMGIKVKFASSKSVITPSLADTKLHGPSHNLPTDQYLDVKSPKLITLDDDMLVVGVNDDISTHYGISMDTGVLEVNKSSQALLAPLKDVPHLSRDGGQGGYLNGQHLFIFSDTGSYSNPTATANGVFLGFISSSVAVDVGMNGLQSQGLNLQDGIGQWSDDVGRMRGFAPLTQGEQSYNKAMQGKGQRYAIWPESSIIPLGNDSAILYAPIVYTNVDHSTKKAVFTYTGSTLLTVTAGGMGGPIAERTVDRLFEQDEIEWGCAGGMRSWGPSGVGGTDGKVYVFGNVRGGMLLGRTSADTVADRDSYEYWDGDSWSSTQLNRSSQAFFITGSPIMDVDIFYSPRHLTFVAVYLTVFADSTFYYRYLKADLAILPSYAPGGNQSEDIVEKMVHHEWSDEKLLYKAPKGLDGHYIYAGGVHQGYFGSDDITNGGTRMLLSWTSPTGLDPSTLESEYEIVTAEVHWD